MECFCCAKKITKDDRPRECALCKHVSCFGCTEGFDWETTRVLCDACCKGIRGMEGA